MLQWNMNGALFFLLVEVSVRFTEEDYRINESEETVTICVRRLGDAASSLTVTVRSRETFPISARGTQAILSDFEMLQS